MKSITFYKPKHVPDEGVFGAATLGFAGKPRLADDASFDFSCVPGGTVLNGTYDYILENIPRKDYLAAIVLCGNAGGENAFVRELFEKIRCPIVGGGAAMDGNIGGLIAGGGQASVLLIDDKRYKINIKTKNIHEHIVGQCKVDFDEENPRIITAIDGEEPREWLANHKRALGLSEDDFEHFTLSDLNHVNAHLSLSGDRVMSGRDLEHEMVARYILPSEVYKSVFDFYNDDENTIVFGCAGIKGITGEISEVASLGLYMYGEICIAGAGADFGNLMLSKITITKK